MAERVGVVGVASAGLPPRFGPGDGIAHGIEVEEIGVRQGLADGRDADAVAQQVAHGSGALAGDLEPGPVPRHRIVQRDQSVVDELEDQRPDHGLADRVHVDERVAGPGSCPGGIGIPAPEVDDHLTRDDDVDGRAHLTVIGEVRRERVGHRPVARGARALDHELAHRSTRANNVFRYRPSGNEIGWSTAWPVRAHSSSWHPTSVAASRMVPVEGRLVDPARARRLHEHAAGAGDREAEPGEPGVCRRGAGDLVGS